MRRAGRFRNGQSITGTFRQVKAWSAPPTITGREVRGLTTGRSVPGPDLSMRSIYVD